MTWMVTQVPYCFLTVGFRFKIALEDVDKDIYSHTSLLSLSKITGEEIVNAWFFNVEVCILNILRISCTWKDLEEPFIHR